MLNNKKLETGSAQFRGQKWSGAPKIVLKIALDTKDLTEEGKQFFSFILKLFACIFVIQPHI